MKIESTALDIKNSITSSVGMNPRESAVSQSKGSSFKDYLLTAMSEMNAQQMDVSKIQEQVITDPDSVDIHDVTIAMAKARSSLNLAQTVIDHLVKGWTEITTTR